MRAFNKNPNYLSERPNINWDDSFVPPQLYVETELASPDGGERQQVQGDGKEWEKEKAGEKMEERVSKDKANTMENDKGKAKETAQDKESFDEIEKPKRKWTRNSNLIFDFASDNEDSASSDESEPLAKRVNRKEFNDSVGIIPFPLPVDDIPYHGSNVNPIEPAKPVEKLNRYAVFARLRRTTRTSILSSG